jgi:flagellar basal body-associated protein FliL
MWRRKDDLEYNNNNYDNEEKPKKHTCLIIYCVIYVLMIIAAALLIYFLFPREPTIQQNGIHVNYFSLNSSYMRINATAYVNITNPNYVSIILKSANIKIR